MTLARVQVYDPLNVTYRGELPTKGLTVSDEVGSAGSVTFSALASDLDDVSAWDSVVRLEVWDGDSWVTGPPYTLRPPYTRDKVTPAGVDSVWRCTATAALLEQWSLETCLLPESVVADLPPGAGRERVLGWPSSAYIPEDDAHEDWDGCYETSRSTYPTTSLTTGEAWPSGSGAKWISITGASDEAERKLFRTAGGSPLTIAVAGPVRVLVASDSPGRFMMAGEPMLDVQGGEPGKEPITFEQADMWLEPGEYACAYDTESIWDTGGDGVDPTIIAICSLDSSGDPDEWLLVSNDTDWVACRRDLDPPDNEPPGPTPGQLIRYLVEEAQERSTSGWPSVTLGFTDTHDSYDEPWSTVVVERLMRVASDNYWTVFQALAEANEADVWLTAGNVLHAAPRQGTTPAVSLTGATVTSMSETRGGSDGSVCYGLSLAGWINGVAPGIRREFYMELGTTMSRASADRVILSALTDAGRRDFRAKLLPIVGVVPLVDYRPGDRVPLVFGDVDTDVVVLSVSGEPGEGGLLWQAELVAVTS